MNGIAFYFLEGLIIDENLLFVEKDFLEPDEW